MRDQQGTGCTRTLHSRWMDPANHLPSTSKWTGLLLWGTSSPSPPSDMEQTRNFDVATNVSRPAMFTMHKNPRPLSPPCHHWYSYSQILSWGMHPIDSCITWILIYHSFVHIIKIVQGNGHSLCEHVTVTMLVLPEFNSEPRFKPELLWTWPKSSPKFKDCKNRMGN